MESYTPSTLPITAWAEDDRPREKLLNKGRQALSDAELIAILLGSGSPKESAVALSQRILNSVGNNLNELGKRNLPDLMKFKGIGEAKAITIAAAMELGRRRQAADLPERPQIGSSKDAWRIMAPILADLPHEEFWILLLNRSHCVIDKEKLSAGGVNATIADVKLLFRAAIGRLASAIVVCHNHPSGALNPSKQDIDLTMKIKQAGQVLECPLLDHIIVTERGYFSFLDEGML